MKSSPVVKLVVLCIALLVLCEVVLSQRRTPSRVTPKIDWANFSHATAKHQGECASCHKIPTKDWSKSSEFPDLTDYPGHAACVGCHRPQFFKGARPVICSNCHTKTTPRDEVRLAFRNPGSLLEFSIEFPHDKHQDVIASLKLPQRNQVFAHSFKRFDDAYNNCTVCHAQSTLNSKSPAGGWPDNFVPQPPTFKVSPTNHASCFNCHWKGQEPVATNCNGCHKLAKPYAGESVPARISLKFMHEGGGEKKNHIAECTTCHINITKSDSLRGLKPDVPITSCSECHNREGLRQDVSKELAAVDKNRAFVCTYCHTSNVGKLDAPASHYLIAERPPMKR